MSESWTYNRRTEREIGVMYIRSEAKKVPLTGATVADMEVEAGLAPPTRTAQS